MQILADHPAPPVPALQSYIRSLAARLPKQPHTIAVIDSRQSEPFALHGRHILVSLPVFRRVRDEAELAAVVAHALAHLDQAPIVHRDLLTVPAIYLSATSSLHIQPGESCALPIADRDAATLLLGAGFDSTALRRYYERNYQRVENPCLPNLAQRLENLKSLTQTSPTPNSAEFLAARAAAIQLLPLPPSLRRWQPPAVPAPAH